MRTLSRPMFNMGGPIKQGIMNGIREPHKDGERVGANLVGDPVYPKTGGREHHFAFGGLGVGALAAIARFGPAAWRGFKAARAYKPWAQNLGWTKRAKDILAPSAGIGAPMAEKGAGLGFRVGSLLKSNPMTALSLAPQAGAIGYGAAKGTLKSIPGIAKSYVEAILPGDQSGWWKEEEPAKDLMKPGGYPEAGATGKGKSKALTKDQKEKWANAQRGKRLNNLLEIMGYDQSKKTAIGDALIDASKIVGERGTLDLKNINRDLINPIIQATSKRLDKPEQIREAVGLMMAKGEIEKDLYKWKPGTNLKNAQDMAETLNIPLEEAMNMVTNKANTLGEELGANQTAKRKPLVASEIAQLTRVWADKKKKNFQKTWTATEIKEAGLDKEDAIDIVSKAITGPDDDGLYVVGTEVIEVINGVAKKKW